MNTENTDRMDERHSESDSSFEKLIELSRRDFDSILVPPFDAEAFLRAELPRVERDLEKRRRWRELIDLSRADFDAISVPEVDFDAIVRRWAIEGKLQHRQQHIQNQLADLASKRLIANVQSEDLTTVCEEILDLTIATWQDTPREFRAQLKSLSDEVREVAEDFARALQIKEKLDELESYVMFGQAVAPFLIDLSRDTDIPEDIRALAEQWLAEEQQGVAHGILLQLVQRLYEWSKAQPRVAQPAPYSVREARRTQTKTPEQRSAKRSRPRSVSEPRTDGFNALVNPDPGRLNGFGRLFGDKTRV